MYELAKLTVRFGDRRILDAVSLRFGPEPVAVMGPSGSGKTTFLRVLAGQLRPNIGRVMLDGGDLRRAKGFGLDARIAFIHQDYRLVEFISVLDNVLLACELRGVKRTDREARVLLERVGLTGSTLTRLPTTLSGGEQQRVAIARALLCGATVLLADEPTGALDRATTWQIAELLVELATDQGVQVVVATHDRTVAGAMHHLMVLNEGRLSLASANDISQP